MYCKLTWPLIYPQLGILMSSGVHGQLGCGCPWEKDTLSSISSSPDQLYVPGPTLTYFDRSRFILIITMTQPSPHQFAWLYPISWCSARPVPPPKKSGVNLNAFSTVHISVYGPTGADTCATQIYCAIDCVSARESPCDSCRAILPACSTMGQKIKRGRPGPSQQVMSGKPLLAIDRHWRIAPRGRPLFRAPSAKTTKSHRGESLARLIDMQNGMYIIVDSASSVGPKRCSQAPKRQAS